MAQQPSRLPTLGRAVIYARYSTDEQRPESIDDQITSCRRYCEKMGWEIVGTYADAAISGASTKERPEFNRLTTDIEKRKFDFVVTEAMDRMSRSLADTASLLDRLMFREIKIHTVDKGEVSTLMAGIFGAINQTQLEDIRHKTKRGQIGNVLKGKVAGGKTYGYIVAPGGEGERLINPEQAEIVRRIFSEYASGASPRAIATRLNDDKIPAPSGGEWNDTSIRGQVARGTGILNSMAYIGKITYGCCSYVKNPATGKRVPRPKPIEEWEIGDAPHLRIVEDDIWHQVKARQAEVRTEMARDESGNALNRAHRRKYLLSGLLICGCCGSPYIKADALNYRCNKNRSKGTCTNSIAVKRADIEGRVIHALQHRLMQPDVVERMIQKMQLQYDQQAKSADVDLATHAVKLKTVDAKINNLVVAIAATGHSTAIMTSLKALEENRTKLMTEMEEMRETMGNPLPPFDAAEVIRLHTIITEEYLGVLLNPQYDGEDVYAKTLEIQDLFRSMIARITIFPSLDGAQYELVGSFAGILEATGMLENGQEKAPSGGPEGAISSVVAGTGFEPVTFRL